MSFSVFTSHQISSDSVWTCSQSNLQTFQVFIEADKGVGQVGSAPHQPLNQLPRRDVAQRGDYAEGGDAILAVRGE